MSAGLVALGDSITRDGGEPMLGLPARPWVAWLADALGLGLANLAADGAQAGDVLREQAPRLPGACRIATVYVGVNDARDPAWDANAYAYDLRAVLAAGRASAAALLVCTVPEDLGRPTAAPKPVAANRIVRAAAAATGALVVALDDLAGPDLVLPDKVHVTAAGQLEIARRALAALGRLPLAPLPVPDDGPQARAAWAARRAELDAEDLERQERERGG